MVPLRTASVFALRRVGIRDRWGLTAKVAYETAGYLMAQPLDAGFYGYAGFTLAR